MKIQFIDRKSGNKITETPPGEGFLKLLYHNPFGKMALLPIAKRKFLSSWYGKLMDKPNSVTKIEGFVNDLGIDMNEAQKPIEEYVSFNDFFYRKLKRGARPIENGFVSPGDGKMLAFENIADIDNFFVKGRQFTLKEFLGNDALAEKHKNSSLIILRLAPNDYHRYHFPFKGMPSKMTKIKGSYFSVSPYALAANFTKVFCENKREYCILSSQVKGDIIVAPVGATMVGSIIETYTANLPVKKGDEMGYFAFGGSTIVLIVDKKNIKIDADILKNTKNRIETFVKMGEKIGL
ncbi:archaetidylserine decarboxylase [Tenacibaculum finnmarkense]|uniref:phosphatidylserine decarboxylase n=1 Tax=Tenacibaculum finnmarkense genomovar finnmarkense TaxID=1458503 RepID=A0AAP1WG52_9FLAO|nr:archaetidylserine decarboxylase [Tenacibaculum finnmarkense]MBE7652720.1 phosphatidylserine decarboxylase [Tenacibaculum finnmarkense genomovar finnmarkense]MBE7695003.1 phosphatidylserine decarboxylase [Tenacibaculum finnmarkense genomovar finnmarkense]MCD8427256.1 archaetidylserine decarboxylase [Tenacibaculum finnmarkense genomovar finnmarkense]MCG8731069.1 phosphatidylserine decarboxylase [Tenacibaculum finnmarkense]MCG8751173.1 phosphatidylserine decarboxylase [Tenacibaculum finnmarken